MKYHKDKSIGWLMSHKREIATGIAGDDPAAITAILKLFGSETGVRAYRGMRTNLSPEEWAKLYYMCKDDPENLMAMSVIMINQLDDKVVHKNFALTEPASFAEDGLKDPHELSGNELYDFQRNCRDSFMKRYSTARNNQPNKPA